MRFSHQYIQRESGAVCTETLLADELVSQLYSRAREHAPSLFRHLTSMRASRLLGWVNYDLPLGRRHARRLRQTLGVDTTETLEPGNLLDSPRKIFERKIRYWDCRPMPEALDAIVSPADSRMLAGSLQTDSILFLKEKFFTFQQLVGVDRPWRDVFVQGDFAVFRLTPDKYHYNHSPVSGRVLDIYAIEGSCHSCNPTAVVAEVTPYSKNRRVVTIIDTDVPGGTRVGKVAVIEVVALMIGHIQQCYSAHRYDRPVAVAPGLFLLRGRPKSLYRPGSSVDVLLFEKGRVAFSPDILANMTHSWAESRFSAGFGRKLVETDVRVRSQIACRKGEK